MWYGYPYTPYLWSLPPPPPPPPAPAPWFPDGVWLP
jgi:hypothetical protein